MTATKESLAAKKRIMFIKGEDFNFLTYQLLLLLDVLGCTSRAHAFKDHRKLAYLMDFISSPQLVSMLLRRKQLDSKLSARDIQSLTGAYTAGFSRKHLISRVINALVAHGLIGIDRSEVNGTLTLWLTGDCSLKAFLKNELYQLERANIGRLLQISRLLRTLTFETFLQKYFIDNGVKAWHS